jgi:hypothetical protein
MNRGRAEDGFGIEMSNSIHPQYEIAIRSNRGRGREERERERKKRTSSSNINHPPVILRPVLVAGLELVRRLEGLQVLKEHKQSMGIWSDMFSE